MSDGGRSHRTIRRKERWEQRKPHYFSKNKTTHYSTPCLCVISQDFTREDQILEKGTGVRSITEKGKIATGYILAPWKKLCLLNSNKHRIIDQKSAIINCHKARQVNFWGSQHVHFMLASDNFHIFPPQVSRVLPALGSCWSSVSLNFGSCRQSLLFACRQDLGGSSCWWPVGNTLILNKK